MFDFNHWLNRFPGTNFHELNIDWLVEAVKELAKELQHFELINQISYQGIWNITKQYPAWSIVTDNNDGYISIQPVPIGINITNTDYWVKISNFSQELADLGNRVIALEAAMDAAEANITKLEGYRTFATRKFVCVSDSYGLTPTVADSWIGKLQTYLNIPNANYYRSQENGSGFIGLLTPTIKTQFINLASSMSADEKNAITDIILGCGMNDASAVKNGTCTMTEVYNAAQDCLYYVHNTFPNAMIKVFMPGWRLDGNWHKYLRGVMNVYQQASTTIPHVAYIDGINWLHRQALLDSTEYHPNAVGAYCIAKSIASVLEGGTVFCDLAIDSSEGDIVPVIDLNETAIQGVTFTGLKQLYENGTVSMRWRQLVFTINADLTDGSGVKLGTFTDGIMSGGPSLDGYSTTVTLFGTGTVGQLLVYQNELWFTNCSGQTIPANTEITINYGSMSGSVML